MKFKTIQVREQNVEVEIDSDGQFTAKVGEQTYSAKSLEELMPKLERATKQESAKVAISFHRWKDGKLMRGTLTGIHASNNNLLVRWDGVKGVSQEYLSRYGNGDRFLRLNSEEQKEIISLFAARAQAVEAIEKFEKAHHFDAVKEMKAALAAPGSTE